MGGANGAQEPEAQANGATTAGKKAGGQKRKKADAPVVETASPTAEAATPAAEDVTTPKAEKAASPSTEESTSTQSEPRRAEPVAKTEAEEVAHASAPPASAKAEPEIVILATLADEINALEDFAPSVVPKPPAEAPPARRAAPPVKEAVGAGPVVTAEMFEPPLEVSNELYLTLLDDEGEFRAGQLATVKVYVGRGAYGQRPEVEASVTVKVLGTSFRPLILSAATDALGVGVVRVLLPRFTSGRAAIIIRAVAGDDATEMRRIIHQ